MMSSQSWLPVMRHGRYPRIFSLNSRGHGRRTSRGEHVTFDSCPSTMPVLSLWTSKFK